MKRVGKRGEGKFEEICWDEAIDTIAEQLKYTIDTYGNDAIHRVYSHWHVLHHGQSRVSFAEPAWAVTSSVITTTPPT